MALNPLKKLPSVHELLDHPLLKGFVDRLSHSAVTSTVRTVLEEAGRELHNAVADRKLPSAADLAQRIAQRIVEGQPSPIRPLINATGYVFDDRLDGPPLAEEAVAEMAAVARDYAGNDCGRSVDRPVARAEPLDALLHELTGAESSLVVNNNAGAMMLVLAALAAGREVIVSRGQVVALGGNCRLTEAAAQSGASLREVGSTNQTRLEDYLAAIGPTTAAVMLACSDNFAVVGATQSVALAELVGALDGRQLPVIHNLGAGALMDLAPYGLPSQPTLAQSIAAGADVVLSGGEKFIGGPRCGIVLGRKALIERIERHPLACVLRADKLTLAALGATLRLYRDPERAKLDVPALRLLTTSVENLRNRAERLAPQAAATAIVSEATAIADATCIGWGAAPAFELPTWCIALRPAKTDVAGLAAALAAGTPPVVGRVQGDRLLLDLRSVPPRQDMQLIAALEALGPPA